MSANANQSLLTKRVYRLFGRYEREPIRYKSVFIACLLLLGLSAQAFLPIDQEEPPVASKEPSVLLDTLPPSSPPLFVIDGEIQASRTLEDGKLDPNDIAGIKVLKDEKAIQKYGADGQHGVVEITTKQGAIPAEKAASPPPAAKNTVEERVANTMNDSATGNNIITGTVLNEQRMPLIGASILIMGTTVGTISDFNGQFELRLPEECANLVISYVGMRSKEISNVCEGQALEVIMETAAVDVETVMVTAEKPKPRITGTVVNADGTALIGANVLIKGTRVGTITDFDGAFTFQLPEDCATLQFSYVGLKMKEVADICTATNLEIVLAPEEQAASSVTTPEVAPDAANNRFFSDFKVFPNPASEKVNISFQLDQSGNVELSVYTLDGKLIRTLVDQSLDAGTQQFLWQPGANQKGIFQMVMVVGERVVKRQVVVE